MAFLPTAAAAAAARRSVTSSLLCLRNTTRLQPFSSSARALVTDNPIPANDPHAAQHSAHSPVSATNATPTSSEGSLATALQESVEEGEKKRVMQAPNRAGIWSRSQAARGQAMVGPRFEQTVMEEQPRPLAAIDLIHKQPVRWISGKQASCDGGGGPLGHPRIFINVDKPQICACTYCGVPYAKTSNRPLIEAQPYKAYPLDPTGDVAEVPESQSVTGRPLEQR